MIEIKGKFTSAVVHADQIDETSMSQIVQMVNSPGVTNPIKIMPDFHAGKGCVVGFTMPVGDVVVPNIVGVDIGCGMLASRISAPTIDVEELDDKIRSAVPVGFNIHSSPQTTAKDEVEQFFPLASQVGIDKGRLINSLGTLGGGNHFIELGIGSNNDYYITIHSGSRNFGKVIAETYQRRAVEYSSGKSGVLKDMEYMPSDEYIKAMYVAQSYAALNRSIMARNIAQAIGCEIKSQIDCVHNYISPLDNIIRKGAVSAQVGDKIVLPFNRKEGIWIMHGKGNPDWNFSAPHGAGRKMSRSQAKKNLTQEYVDLEMQETGVFSSFNPVDEAPDAYKSPDEIRKYIGETAGFSMSIKPILNVKG